MFHSASLKLGLERAVLSQNREQSDDSDENKKKNDREAQAKEIDELLKKGAYDVFRDEDDTEAEKFMEVISTSCWRTVQRRSHMAHQLRRP
jgi:chromodomain-helicase-DNA-binding protein 7